MTAYSGPHFQKPVNDWPRAAAMLPAGTWFKALDNVQMLDEARRINPGLKTVLRHFDGGWHNFTLGTLAAYKNHARAFFNTFIDGTFMNFAHNVNGVEGLNEFNAASHTPTEINERVLWVQAACMVWANEFRTKPGLGHIRLVSSNVAIGNDIPLEAARAIADYNAIASYHGYVPVQNGVVRPNEWAFYSGRWTVMDARFRAAGITVDWISTEGGPIGYTGDHLWANDGWKHPNVCAGNVAQLIAVLKYWMDRTALWNAAHGGRMLGQMIFNSGGADNEWKLFEIAQPVMDQVAAFNRDYKSPVTPPPPPPPDPAPEPRKYHRTVHLLAQDTTLNEMQAVVEVAYPKRQSVTFSADDSFSRPPEITGRTVYVWEVERVAGSKAALVDWVKQHYAPMPVLTHYRRIAELFVANKWDFLLGTDAQRQGSQVPPPPWYDANPFLNHYALGYHTGSDYNLPSDEDRNCPVRAAANGIVTYVGKPSMAWQNVVVIRHVDSNSLQLFSRSAHLHETFVQQGQWLKRGEIIGTTGRNWNNDANTWGPWHLHFDLSYTEILLTDPGHWPGENKAAVIANYVNPTEYIKSNRIVT